MKKILLIFTLVLAQFLASNAQVWVEKHTNMEFTWIPEGCFQMGCPSKNDLCYFDEKPLRKVCLKGFWISTKEVTLSQWKQFIKESRYNPKAKPEDLWGCTSVGKPEFEQKDNEPVVCVSWHDAVNFAKWLSKKTGLIFRLPTEAEWEYACKGSKGHLCSFGDAPPPGNFANYWSGFGGKSGKDTFKYTAPVGSFKPNDFGLYDMIGNVWEWVEDWYTIYNIPSKKEKKVVKGGSWESQAKLLRCSTRKAISPERRYDAIGFRLVVELPAPKPSVKAQR